MYQLVHLAGKAEVAGMQGEMLVVGRDVITGSWIESL